MKWSWKKKNSKAGVMILQQWVLLNLMKFLPDVNTWNKLPTKKKQIKCSSTLKEPYILFPTVFEQVDAENRRKKICTTEVRLESFKSYSDFFIK